MEPNPRMREVAMWVVMIAVLGALMFQAYWISNVQPVETIPYSRAMAGSILLMGCGQPQ